MSTRISKLQGSLFPKQSVSSFSRSFIFVLLPSSWYYSSVLELKTLTPLYLPIKMSNPFLNSWVHVLFSHATHNYFPLRIQTSGCHDDHASKQPRVTMLKYIVCGSLVGKNIDYYRVVFSNSSLPYNRVHFTM